MKTLWVVLIILAIASPVLAEDVIKFAYARDAKPFSWGEGGKMQGILIDVVNFQLPFLRRRTMRPRDLLPFVIMITWLCPLCPDTRVLAGEVRSMELSKFVPDQLSYQGYLVDAADSSVINATREMTFRLFDSETKGAELWSETHSMVQVDRHLPASRRKGATKAPVGQASRQRRQRPQREATLCVSGPRFCLGRTPHSGSLAGTPAGRRPVISRLVRATPRNRLEPKRSCKRQVFLPQKPRPANQAYSRSR